MKYIILTAPKGYQDTVEATLEMHGIQRRWWEASAESDEEFTIRLIAPTTEEVGLLDDLQKAIAASADAAIHTMNVDSSFPAMFNAGEPAKLSRDELIIFAEQGARSDSLYFLLVSLSTIVASIGLLQNNIAVVIGAMVIAPLLGPNLSFALGVALGEFSLARRAMVSFVQGITLAFVLSLLVGKCWPEGPLSSEILSRTVSGLDSPLLALASGTAAVLSMTSGIQGVMVGVMVAVALMPPLATSGILLGLGKFDLALGAMLLFVVNVAAINLSAHLTLLYQAVRPRTAAMSISARRNTLYSAIFWFIILALVSYASLL